MIWDGTVVAKRTAQYKPLQEGYYLRSKAHTGPRLSVDSES